MTKKRGKAKRRTRKSSRGPDLTLQLIKIAGGLTVLVMLVLGAAVLANHFLRKPSPPAKAAVRPAEPLPLPPAKKPVYEVFPQSRPPAEAPARLPRLPLEQPPLVAIIIDDIGYDRRMANLFLDLDIPLTFSMLPYGPFNRSILTAARSNGVEIMLHLPMEPDEYPDVKPGPGAVLHGMSPDELIAQLEKNLDQFPGLKGVNNHMGSRISTSPEQMRQIFSILRKRDLFYIDSRTTAHTVAQPSARLLQLPFAQRDIFIDHFDDPAFIRSQMHRLIRRAQKQGYAIGIAHPHENTYQVLKEFVPRLKADVTLVPASAVVGHAMVAEAAEKTATTARP